MADNAETENNSVPSLGSARCIDGIQSSFRHKKINMHLRVRVHRFTGIDTTQQIVMIALAGYSYVANSGEHAL